MPLGMYVPGDSPLHRAGAGAKLIGLAVVLLPLGILRTPVVVLAEAALLAVLVVVSGLGAGPVLAQLRVVFWLTMLLAAVQVWLAGPLRAAVIAGSLLVAIGLAALVTLTTRTEDLLDAIVAALRPLRRFGLDPDRVGLVLSLAVRSIPVLAELAVQVQQARKARGAERSLRAFAVPLVIRAVRHADQLGEALAARGVDD